MRLASGEEALVARVVTEQGAIGFGFSFRLDAAAARHMAEWQAGVLKEKPLLVPALNHPWEQAFLDQKPIPWECEPGFSSLRWLPQ